MGVREEGEARCGLDSGRLITPSDIGTVRGGVDGLEVSNSWKDP